MTAKSSEMKVVEPAAKAAEEKRRPKPVEVKAPDDGRKPVQVISEFQSDAVELEERVPPRVARMTLYSITAFLIAAVTWASVSSVDEIVVAPGKLVTTQPTIVVQPLETSIIRTIDVEAGDVVKAGQTLVTFDPTFTQADVDRQKARLAVLDAQVSRSQAELDGSDYATLAGSSDEEQLQVRLFQQRRAYYAAQLQNFDQQVAVQQAAMDSNRSQEAVLKNQSDTLAQIETTRQALFDKQNGSLLDLLTSRNSRLDVDATRAQMEGSRVEAEHTIAKLEADRAAFIQDYRRATMEQLVDFRGKRDEAAEELKKMELRRNMVTLTAPSDAVVLELAAKSIGSVVREAEPVVTLVPVDVPLEAEVSVNSRDIGQVAAGDVARVKFDAYPFQKFGTADGSIRTVSRDAFTPDGKADAQGAAAMPYFKARVLIDDKSLDTREGPMHLLPGMTVTAEIKVGTRTIISYFLYPLLRGLDDSIREP
ncbi:HlyD family type I secretion periplasmic adaptor subunit [Paradevosia shaoguanensis]|uniref:Membrane fusion protein (MFP) family protein n=1 Tax=Paradevosia shaoguanensis TaxID=1335043 RepID=A0AA41QSC7_9HYPH|nr:HlyD family type I secretion periplasmic adaptor subunit [Paradevosia shaoguanensis]MCF1744283.1 HlyD family type I secretion periplasmic adaptor subunit [Paradevosia shaoguanensis]MCI0128766.1 HlyD family type I secretion periplasmic adaptor subunit [Paradevosia shaoguanensis]